MSVTESEKLKKSLFGTVIGNRSRDFYPVRGVDRGRVGFHLILVHCDKRQQFDELDQIERTTVIDFADYGIVLESVFGQDPPLSFIHRRQQFTKDLVTNLVMVKLQKEGYEKNYYLVPDVATYDNFRTASSEGEIRRMGRILYCSRDEDPVESFCEIIIQVYFRLAEYNQYIPPGDNELFREKGGESLYSFLELLDSVRKGELEIVRIYLKADGDVNFADEYGRTLLHLAAHSGNLNLIRFLKYKGADIQAEDKLGGRKPIHIAAKEGHPSVISFFLKGGASIDECDKLNWTPLHYAVWRGDLSTIRFLIENGANINAEEIHGYKKPIHIAAEHAYIDVIKYLLENGANIEDVDIQERTPLYHSVMHGHFKTSKFLIGKNADKHTKTKTEKSTLLHAAIFGNGKEIIEFLVKEGLDINEKDGYGWTPLHYAVKQYKLRMLQVLADLGANFFAVDKAGKIPLALTEKEHADMVLHVVYHMCKKLQEEGKYNDAAELYDENLEIIKKLRQENPEYLEIQNKIGVMLYEMDQYERAETTFKDVLKKREMYLQTAHLSTLCTIRGLGLVCGAQKRYSEAMEHLNNVLVLRKINLGKYHDDTLDISRDIANVQFNNGKYDEALETIKHVLKKRKKHFGSNHLKTLQARNDMAVILVMKGNFKMALKIFKDVLEKRIILLGNNHPDTLSTIDHLKLTSEKIKETTPRRDRCSIS